MDNHLNLNLGCGIIKIFFTTSFAMEDIGKLSCQYPISLEPRWLGGEGVGGEGFGKED